MVALTTFLFRLCGFFMLLLLVWDRLTIKYVNPYRFTFVLGKKGSGKNTYLTKIAYKHMAKGWRVYSNTEIPGTYQIEPDDIGRYHIPPRSIVLLDEIGLIWHARSFKEFPKHVLRWFKLQRHHKVKVYATSQDFDVDKALRILADDMYLLCNKLRVFSWGKRIIKYPDLVTTAGEGSQNTLADQLKFDFFLFPGSRMFTWIPRWAKYFNSFDVEQLPIKEFPLFQPENVPGWVARKASKREDKLLRKQLRKSA